MIGERTELNIAKEFTEIPGPRLRSEGDYSGEEFREKLLRPRFVIAMETEGILHVNLDGAVGYPTSFLEEAFGGLAREFGSDKVERTIELTCNDEPYLAEQILKYIRDANKVR